MTRTAPDTIAFEIRRSAHPAELAQAWCAMAQEGGASVFQSHGWMSAWYDSVHAAQLGEPLVLSVHAADGRALMILPLVSFIEDGLRVVSFADLGVCDYNGPVLAAEFAPSPALMRQIWREVRRTLPAHDIIRLEKLPARIGAQPNPMLYLSGCGPDVQECVGTPLSPAPDMPWLAAGFRAKMSERMRKLSKRAEVRLVMAHTPDEALRYLDALDMALASRTGKAGFHNILALPPWRALYAASLTEKAANGRICALMVDGKIEAVAYGLVYSSAFHLIIHSYTGMIWRNYSPGLQMITRLMQWAANEGFSYFDFTLGAESYKADFGGIPQPLFQCVQAGSLHGVIPMLAARAKGALRRHPRLLAWLKRLLGR